MAHRLAPMSVSDELWAALTAEAARQRRTAAAMARVILEDALLPKPEPTGPPDVPEKQPNKFDRKPYNLKPYSGRIGGRR